MAQFVRAALIAIVCALCGPLFAATGASVTTAPDWAQLTSSQREVLKPFESEWNRFSQVRRLKWIGVADRYPKMTPQEQANVRERMSEWSKLTADQRAKAREQYKKLRSAPPAERQQLQEKWREYEALPPEQKQALKAAPRPIPKPSETASAPLATKQPPKPVAVAPRVPKPQRKAPAVQSAPGAQSAPASHQPK